MSPRPPKRPSAASRRSLAASDPQAELLELDQQILELCNRRAGIVQQRGDQQGPGAVAGTLSRQARDRLLRQNSGPLGEAALRAIFRELDSASRSLVHVARVAYLGPEFSYSHLAAIEQFGQSCSLIPVATISAVFEAVDRAEVQFGIVPIENSTDGRIIDTLEMFTRLPVCICGEVPMRIHHNLLGRGELAEIREVHSKPQALSQCREWLSKHLPRARTVPTTSTTAAAESAAADSAVAAIASRQAAVNYELTLLAANIEDNADNVTRFAVIGATSADRTGRDKTSLLFELAHQPGALADAMQVFKRNRLNLTWIESFPKKGCQNEYLFFVELEGHPRELSVRRAIKALEKKTVRIKILGSYARSEPIG